MLPETPYKGLSFYAEQDAPFFFGRERETQIVIANVMASRLTLLYGESGVGKSSLLRAGVARQLRDLARENIRRRGTPRFVVVLFPDAPVSWRDDPVAGLAVAIENAVESLGIGVDAPSRTLSFCELTAAWVERLESDLLIVLDQFEEYLLYHGSEDGAATLATELPRALAEPNLRVSFLISIREDALAKLDRFKGRIPTLFDNYLRVNHLDRRGAYDAIVRPIDTYNAVAGDRLPITVEEQLVETLLDELTTGRVALASRGAGVSDAQADGEEAARVETPYLQLVITRLWSEERGAGSSSLRLETLRRLGGASRIIETHLDAAMGALPRHSQYVAARVLHHLVTPSGMKIAHTAADLAAYSGMDQAEVEPVLERLTAGDTRILRRVGFASDAGTPPRFEIFHDVLAAAILDWRTRHGRAAPPYIRAALAFHVLTGAVIVALARDDAGFVGWVWTIAALAIWVRTSLLLRRWWRHRNAWAVPLVGAFAAAIAPAAAAVAAIYGATRVEAWSSRGRRDGWRRAKDVPSAAQDRPAIDGRARLASLASIAGAGIVVVACFVPLTDFDWILESRSGSRLVFLFRREEAPLAGGGQHLWFAAPAILASVIGVIGVIGLIRARTVRTRFLIAFLGAFGLGGLAYFGGHYLWADALAPVLRPSADVLSEAARTRADPDLAREFHNARLVPEYWSKDVGVFLGAAGAAVILLLAAPAFVVATFARIIGAGEFVQAIPERSPTVIGTEVPGAQRYPWRAAALAVAGAALVVVAAVVPSGAWFRDASASLLEISSGATVQAVVPAIAAGVVAALSLRRPPHRDSAAGFLAGSGLVLAALFAAIVGSSIAEHGAGVPIGGYLGIAGAALVIAAAVVVFRGHPPVEAPAGRTTSA